MKEKFQSTTDNPDNRRPPAVRLWASLRCYGAAMIRPLLALLLSVTALHGATPQRQPNLIWIMADDLGYGDLGCFGQQVITTPNIDRMAAEGMKFTHFYSGAPVCAPSRSVLMTGLHHGHTRVRGNASPPKLAPQALQAEDVTVAKVLKSAGYHTALIGKWGLGDIGEAEAGLPRKQGFDYFYGYLNQQHAHNHFPSFLWRNESKETLSNVTVPFGETGAGYATDAVHYADDLFADDVLKYVDEHKAAPFFLYWALVTPHANNERAKLLGDGAHVPDYGPYANKDWPAQDKGQAAMISRLDGHVGRVLRRLDELGLSKDTLVIFTSDNGPHDESRHDLTRFNPAGPYTGIKRSLTDGGIRVPFIARWPGTVQPGVESSHVGSFADWLGTAAELARATAPAQDSLSFVPELTGRGDQARHEFLYWEFHEGGFKQAALYQSRWKGIRSGGPDAAIVLYDQQNDVTESKDVAAANPDVTAKIDAYLRSARTPSADWEPKWQAGKKQR
jgi:arylsulfatase A-like enzyme